MRVFVEDHEASPFEAVQKAMDILSKARVDSVQGGGTLGNRAVILIKDVWLTEAIAALNKAGMRTAID